MGDGATGAVLLSMQGYYETTYLLVSLVFLVQVLGYGVMSLSASSLLRVLGRRWFITIGSCCMTIGFAMIIPGPPFPVLIVAFILIGLAAGCFEATLNAYAGTFKESVTILGCLHGFYGLGCTVSPIIATQMIVHGIAWHYYYPILTGCALAITVINTVAFRSHVREASQATAHSDIKQVLSSKFCLIGAAFMFLYLGLEISTGGFVVTYLVRVRGGSESGMGFVNSGYWAGLTLGRFVLTPISSYLRKPNEIFLLLAFSFMLVFWLPKSIIAASIGVSLTGFCIGPSFPLIMELSTKKLPADIHVAAIAFVASVGSIGGAILPFLVGILATAKTPRVVPYVLTALLGSCLITWILLNRDEHEDGGESCV